jgi:hypothetical protein
MTSMGEAKWTAKPKDGASGRIVYAETSDPLRNQGVYCSYILLRHSAILHVSFLFLCCTLFSHQQQLQQYSPALLAFILYQLVLQIFHH